MGRIQVNEILDTMADTEPMEKKIAFMEGVCKQDPYILRLLDMAINPALKIDRLPEGYPKNYRPESDLPVGISDTNIRTEFRRIQNYITGGALKVIPEKKLEESWVALMQGLHYQEAEIMTMVKDQNLFDKYPDLWVVAPVLGIVTRMNTEDGEVDARELLETLLEEEVAAVVGGTETFSLDALVGNAETITAPPSVDAITESPVAAPAKETRKGKS